MRTSGLLLAAGFGRRFGADKRLQPLPGSASTPGGTEVPLAVATLARWRGAVHSAERPSAPLDHLYVVTRPDDALAALLRHWLTEHPEPGCTLLVAPDADLGMGHSVAAGAANIPAGPLLIGLADMPYVTTATITALARALNAGVDTQLVQPIHDNRPGNPIGFGAGLRNQLLSLSGDQGARALVSAAKRANTLTYLTVNDPGIHQDIDTPADLTCNSPPHN